MRDNSQTNRTNGDDDYDDTDLMRDLPDDELEDVERTVSDSNT